MLLTIMSSEAPLMLSVSGARGIVGKTMTPEVSAAFAAAYGGHLQDHSDGIPLVCAGRDGRAGGEELHKAALAGLIAAGCKVIDLDVVATPTVGVMIDKHGASGGIVITASHNPQQWNGLKCLNKDGLAPAVDEAALIIDRFKSLRDQDFTGTAIDSVSVDLSGTTTHVKRVLDQVDRNRIAAMRFIVTLDSVNASGCEGGRQLLTALGCQLTHLHASGSGIFPHSPEPTQANLTELASVTKECGAVVGFAQDPDADRLALISQRGEYVGEEYTLAMVARRFLAREHGGVLAANLSTSRMIDDLAEINPGVSVIRTAVGEANVVHALRDAGVGGEKTGMGGEGNGGVICPSVCWIRDSLSAMAFVLELLATEGRSLSDLIDEMPKYAMIKQAFDLSSVGGHDGVGAIFDRVRKAFASEKINDLDGLRVDRANAWVHLRVSNTEPIVRLIAEAPTNEDAESLIREVASIAGL